MPRPEAPDPMLDPDTEDRDAEVPELDEPEEELDEQDEPLEDESDPDGDADQDNADEEPEDERYDKIEAQLGQLANAVQSLVQSSGRRGPPAASPAPRAQKDFDEMTGRELAGHFTQYSHQQSAQVIQQVAAVLQRQQAAMFLLAQKPDEHAIVHKALEMTYQQPNIPLEKAYEIAQGLAASGKLGQAQKKLDKYKKQNRKRGRRARLASNRPTPAPAARKTAITDIRSAMRAAEEQLAAQGVNVPD